MIEHGYFWLQFSENMIYLRIRGPWNLKTFNRYNAEMHGYISNIKNSKISALAILEGESLMIPEVFESFKSGVTSRISMGLTNIAFSIVHSESPHTLKHQIRKLYEDLDINYDIFSSLHQAKNWLESFDVNIDQDQVNKLFR